LWWAYDAARVRYLPIGFVSAGVVLHRDGDLAGAAEQHARPMYSACAALVAHNLWEASP
jgi:hypothetical protein